MFLYFFAEGVDKKSQRKLLLFFRWTRSLGVIFIIFEMFYTSGSESLYLILKKSFSEEKGRLEMLQGWAQIRTPCSSFQFPSRSHHRIFFFFYDFRSHRRFIPAAAAINKRKWIIFSHYSLGRKRVSFASSRSWAPSDSNLQAACAHMAPWQPPPARDIPLTSRQPGSDRIHSASRETRCRSSRNRSCDPKIQYQYSTTALKMKKMYRRHLLRPSPPTRYRGGEHVAPATETTADGSFGRVISTDVL